MNIYTRKQNWKLWLLVGALIIVVSSLWYTNVLVKKIANEERNKVKLWADAIRKKAVLVKYTQSLFEKIREEERKRIETWAQASKLLISTSGDEDRTFYLQIVSGNTNIPVILTNQKGDILSWSNVDSVPGISFAKLAKAEQERLVFQLKLMQMEKQSIEIPYYKTQKNYLFYADSKLFTELKSVLDDLIKSFISEVVINSASVPVLFTDEAKKNVLAYGNININELHDSISIKNTIALMSAQNEPIEVDLGNNEKNYIYYYNSFLLTQLKYYPFIQLAVIAVFLLIAYTLFSTSRKAEQNQVWVGMAKETAHQLGTPLSSLMAWLELFKARGMDSEMNEIEKDVKRLEVITDRFSKIGSQPVLEKENLNIVLSEAIQYMKDRSSKKVHFTFDCPTNLETQVNVALFQWVIENLIRNAVDAMEGSGEISISASDQIQFVYIDICDSGKGIPKANFKTIFEPGFTTKRRGWGLGLSLTKRIIENYHNGKIFVKSSEINKGTCFRIVLNK